MSLGLGLGLGLHTGRWNDGRVLDLDLVNSGGPAPLGTYTRSTPAMQFDSSGVLGWVPHNLLLRSEELLHASWTSGGRLADGSGSTSNAIADSTGALTADFWGEDTSNGAHYLYQSVATQIGNPSTFVVEYHSSSTRSIRLTFYDTSNKGATFANDGTVSAVDAGVTATATSLGGGWWKCSIVYAPTTNPASASVFGYHPVNATAYTGVAGTGFYIARARVHYGTTALTYVPTTSAAVTNLPRPDYDPATLVKRGWLMEGSRTNICLRSEEFSVDGAGAPWQHTRATVSANATTAPDGASTADKILEDATGSATHVVLQGLALSTASWCASCYLKAAERTWARFGMYDGAANKECYFNLSTGAVGTASAGMTGSIESVGNGWYRCAVYGSITDTGGNTVFVGPTTGDNTASFNGDITKGIYAWGMQVEQATFPSSYIPTTTASAPRSADLWTISNAQFLAATGQNIPQAEGTMFVEYAYAGGGSALGAYTRVAVSVDDGTTSSRHNIYNINGNVGGLTSKTVLGSPVTQAAPEVAAPVAANTVVKALYTWKNNDCQFWINGSHATRDTATADGMPTTNAIGIGSVSSGNSPGFIWLRRVIIYPFHVPLDATGDRMTA